MTKSLEPVNRPRLPTTPLPNLDTIIASAHAQIIAGITHALQQGWTTINQVGVDGTGSYHFHFVFVGGRPAALFHLNEGTGLTIITYYDRQGRLVTERLNQPGTAAIGENQLPRRIGGLPVTLPPGPLFSIGFYTPASLSDPVTLVLWALGQGRNVEVREVVLVWQGREIRMRVFISLPLNVLVPPN